MPKKFSKILGISYAHGDSSAALICDGVLVAAAEEERFNRQKHSAAIPVSAIRYCLAEAGVNPSDVDCVAIARKPFNAWSQKARLLLTNPALLKNRPERDASQSIAVTLKELGIRASLRYFEHHHAHIASVRHCSPRDMALMSFDGLGDFVSACMGVAEGNNIKVLERVYFPHSIGFFYTAMTQYLGFPYFGDEFKVMGLSSYGEAKFLTEMRDLLQSDKGFSFKLNEQAFPISKLSSAFSVRDGVPHIKNLYNANFLTSILGNGPRKKKEALSQKHKDIAKSIQARFEEVANDLLNYVHDKTGLNTIGLAGGCAHNSVWVGKIIENTKFEFVHVAPASNDAGIAVGAAVLAWGEKVTTRNGSWVLLGPDENYRTRDEKDSHPLSATPETTHSSDEKLIAWMAQALSDGAIIGLMNGRMEFGPRALGNRSILCDPRDASMKDKLNLRVKHREPFRPFAASFLWEDQEKWLEKPFFSPTMEAVFQVKKDKLKKIPAVVHADDTCRIQSVEAKSQPFFHALITKFKELTGVPALVNTSFNDSEPVVCTPRDAMNCFENCDMDYLVIGRSVYSQKKLRKTA